MGWVEKNWFPIGVMSGILGIAWWIGKEEQSQMYSAPQLVSPRGVNICSICGVKEGFREHEGINFCWDCFYEAESFEANNLQLRPYSKTGHRRRVRKRSIWPYRVYTCYNNWSIGNSALKFPEVMQEYSGDNTRSFTTVDFSLVQHWWKTMSRHWNQLKEEGILRKPIELTRLERSLSDYQNNRSKDYADWRKNTKEGRDRWANLRRYTKIWDEGPEAYSLSRKEGQRWNVGRVSVKNWRDKTVLENMGVFGYHISEGLSAESFSANQCDYRTQSRHGRMCDADEWYDECFDCGGKYCVEHIKRHPEREDDFICLDCIDKVEYGAESVSADDLCKGEPYEHSTSHEDWEKVKHLKNLHDWTGGPHWEDEDTFTEDFYYCGNCGQYYSPETGIVSDEEYQDLRHGAAWWAESKPPEPPTDYSNCDKCGEMNENDFMRICSKCSIWVCEGCSSGGGPDKDFTCGEPLGFDEDICSDCLWPRRSYRDYMKKMGKRGLRAESFSADDGWKDDECAECGTSMKYIIHTTIEFEGGEGCDACGVAVCDNCSHDCSGAESFEAPNEEMSAEYKCGSCGKMGHNKRTCPRNPNVKVVKDVTPKRSKITVEECIDIRASKADPTANYYRMRFRDPKYFSNYRVPAWAARAANTMGRKYYDVTGSKVTMGQNKAGKWKIQSVMVPKIEGVTPKLALKIANHIQDRLEREGKWATKECKDNERILLVK